MEGVCARDCVDEKSEFRGGKGCSDESVPAESSFLPDPPISFPQSRANALVMIAESFLASDGVGAVTGGVGFKGAERCQLMLHIQVGSGLEPSSGLEASLDGRWIGRWLVMRVWWLLRRMRWAIC
jgi:hypothetical protein